MINRGEVFKAVIDLPNRTVGKGTVSRTKFLVALQGGPSFDSMADLAVVIGSTHRRKAVRPFEVLVGPGDGFDHDTVIDCRWVYTLPKTLLPNDPEFKLSSEVMHQVSVALVVGLQMQA